MQPSNSRRQRTPGPPTGVVRVHLDHLRDPFAHFDLGSVDRELRKDPAFHRDGHTAVTLVKHPDHRVVLMAMRARSRTGEHRAEARLSIQALRGRATVLLPEGPVSLRAGHLVTLERGMAHEVRADAECAVLLTLSGLGRGEAIRA